MFKRWDIVEMIHYNMSPELTKLNNVEVIRYSHPDVERCCNSQGRVCCCNGK